MWHLDTNIVVACLRGDRAVAERLRASLPHVTIDTIVLAKLLYGVRASSRESENLLQLRRFLQLVEVVPFDEDCADAYSRIRLALRRKGQLTSEIDNLIAAVCMGRGATLVTRNVRHFEAIEGLKTEDWR